MAVITYDVSGRQDEVKAAMIQRGYLDYMSNGGGFVCYLPYTTLWNRDKDLRGAVADIQAVAAAMNVHLERAVALAHEAWWAITGDPHK